MSIPWEGLMDMYYIYCYTNKVNQHKYVGQTNNLKRRIKEHRSCSKNPKSLSYNYLFHKKLRQYGEDNFDIEILEILYTDDQEIVNRQEKFWIQEKNSYCLYHCGYNMTEGGDTPPRSSKFSDEDIINIKLDLSNNDVSFFDIQNKYKISPAMLSMINHGRCYYNSKQNYPIRKYYKDDTDYDELIELLACSTLSFKEISEQLNIGYSTVKKINSGSMKHGLYPTYPIRKIDKSDIIKKELKYTDSSFEAIAEHNGCSITTVKRINEGVTHFNKNELYPLRNL